MTKPSIPSIPGFGAMTETIDFVKNMWGGMSTPGMGIPGMVMPTLSVEDIDKQIKDLKAVESWLTVNMSMLRGTIQALEVQSATISTLKSMGESLSASVKQNTAGTSTAASGAAASFPFSFPATAAATAAAAKGASETATPAKPADKENASHASGNGTAQKTDSPASMPLPNPAIWWNMLQEQFKQAVSTAMTPEPGSASAKEQSEHAAQQAQPEQAPEDASPAAARKRKAPPK
ncbi:MAG: hypothetical protein H7234_09935 [Herminiimonas sp.]|nr:hypothetical protein [Herminiimonas sp.]